VNSEKTRGVRGVLAAHTLEDWLICLTILVDNLGDVMDTCDYPAAEAAAPPPPDQPLPVVLSRQDGPIDPAARERIVAYLAGLTERGAVETKRGKDGRPILGPDEKPITKKVSPRHAFRAMRLLNTFGRQALHQRRLDRAARRAEGRAFCLNDHVTETVNLAGQRQTEEARRRGLSCAAELDIETQRAINAAAEAELVAAGLVDPTPAVTSQAGTAADPARRRDWVIPAAVQAGIMARLVDMVDPQGDEFAVLRLRERLMAAGVLGLFSQLALEQQEFDLVDETAGEVFDEERALAEMDEAERLRLAERKRWREEAAARAAGAAAC
jgi:hypothetical protein